MDLRVVDRHLEFLQQESTDMKALVESMVASNARWIEALAGCGLAPRASLSPSEPPAVSPPVSPLLAPVVTPDDSLRAMTEALAALQAKYDALMGEHSRVLEHRTLLETKLRQEMLLNQELRAHVDQLTQYTESLIVGDDMTTTVAGPSTQAKRPSLTDDEDPALGTRHHEDVGNQALHDCPCSPPTPGLVASASSLQSKDVEPEQWALLGSDALDAVEPNQLLDENASPPPTLSRMWCVSPTPVGVLTAKSRVPSLHLDDELQYVYRSSNQMEEDSDLPAIHDDSHKSIGASADVEPEGRGHSSDKRAIVERRHRRDHSLLPASPTCSDSRRSRPPSPSVASPASLVSLSPRSLFEQFRHLQ
ncbi:hypothetical protein P43SY_010089 [Pythium insidiosum]|uniref:Uncharacterized protein n=1 Tax=Pythium insidiosum TaxID=114742 RepID=A0AAD5QDB9_PYTIN|nr:hypothetical protein P43SY_010089 [Pythium insidiosum]